MQPSADSFADLIRKHRVDRGLSQDDLADRVGYAGASKHAIVSRVETAGSDRSPHRGVVSRLVRALHAERSFSLTELHQLALAYLGLDSLDAFEERSHLGVCIAGVAFSSFWSEIVAHLAMCAGPWCNLVLRMHGEDLGSEQEILTSFIARAHSLYGVMLAPALGLHCGPTSRQMEIRRDLIRQLQDRDVPVVLLDRRLTDADQAALRRHAPVISIDNYDAGRKAVRKLCEAGHRRIGVLLDMEHCYLQRERCSGAIDEMRAQGLDVDRRLIAFGTSGQRVDATALGKSPFGYHNTRMNANAIVAGRDGVPPPTALLCTTSFVTLEAYTALVRDRHVKIPDQMSLLGFDDVNELHHLGISRVPYRPSEVAEKAFEKINDYYDSARKANAHVDRIWTVSNADADWAICTKEEPGTIRRLSDA